MSFNTTRRTARRWVREPPLLQRTLWKALSDGDAEDVPAILRAHYTRALFTKGSRGELNAWLTAMSKCEAWLRWWLSTNGTAIPVKDNRVLTVPNGDADHSDVLLTLSFLAALMEHSRYNTPYKVTAIDTVSAFLDSPSLSVTTEALAVLHWYAASQQQRQQHDFDHATRSKLITLAAGWESGPSLLRSAGLSSEPLPDSTAVVSHSFYTSTFGSRAKTSAPAGDGDAPLSAALDARWVETHTSESGEVSVRIDVRRVLADTFEGAGAADTRLTRILHHVIRTHQLSYQHAYAMWTRLRMAADMPRPERLQGWAVVRLLALAVTSSADEDGLRAFLVHCAEWFQDIKAVLSDEAAPCEIVTAALQLLSVLLSSPNAREALSSSDLRGSALSPSTLSTSQGRLLAMLSEAPAGMQHPSRRAEDGSLLPKAQSMYAALVGFASVFAVSQGSSSNARTLNTVIIAPLLEVPRLRVPGTEKVAVKCLSVLESLLVADNLLEQVIEAGVVELLLQLLQEEVQQVAVGDSADGAEAMEVDAPEPDAEKTYEQLRGEMKQRAEAARRLPYGREGVLAHILRTFALCIGTSKGHPVALFAEERLQAAFKTILQHPDFFGYNAYKFAVHAVATMINTDRTVCQAIVDAGFLDILLQTIRNPPLDPRYLTVLPQVLRAFCLCPAGVKVIKEATLFKYIFAPMLDPVRWCTVSPSDAGNLGSEVNDLVKHGDKALMAECAVEVYRNLTAAVDGVVASGWGRPAMHPTKPLNILQHQLWLLLNLRGSGQGTFARQLELQAAMQKRVFEGLLSILELVCHTFHRPLVAATVAAPTPQATLTLASSLKADLVQVLCGTSQVAALWETYLALENTAAVLPEAAFDVARWEESIPSSASSSPLRLAPKVEPTPWPQGGGLVLHRVATCAHLLSMLAAIDGGKGDHLQLFVQPLAERAQKREKEKSGAAGTALQQLVRVAVAARRWQIARVACRERAFRTAQAGAAAVPAAAAPKGDAAAAVRRDDWRASTSRVAVTAAVVAAVAASVDETEAAADPASRRRGRVAQLYWESFVSWAEALCAGLPRPELRHGELSAQLAEVARTAVASVKEAVECPDIPYEEVCTLFSDVVSGPLCNRILNTDAASRKFYECPDAVLKPFSEGGGVELLIETCAALVQRTLQQPTAAADGYAAPTAALRLLVKFSNTPDKLHRERSSGAAPTVPRTWVTKTLPELLTRCQNAVAEKVSALWSAPELDAHPAMAVKVVEVVGHLVKILQGREVGGKDTPAAAAKPKEQFKPDEEIVSQLTEMGFSRGAVRRGLREIGTNSAELVTDWLVTNEHFGGDDDEDDEEGAGSQEGEAAKDEDSVKAEAGAASEVGPTEDKDPLGLFVSGCAATALRLGGVDVAAVYGASDLLNLLSDVAGQRSAIMTALVADVKVRLEEATAEGGSGVGDEALYRALTHLLHLLPQEGMQRIRRSLSIRSSGLPEGVVSVLRSLVAAPLPCAEEETAAYNAHAQRISICLGACQALTMPCSADEQADANASATATPPKDSVDDAAAAAPATTEGGSSSSPQHADSKEWDILTTSPSDPTPLSPAVAAELLEVLMKVVRTALPAEVVLQCTALLDTLAKQSHAHALQILADAVPHLLATPYAGAWPSPAAAGHIANVCRCAIEDQDFVLSTQESVIRKTFAKIVASPKHAAEVVHVNADDLAKATAAAAAAAGLPAPAAPAPAATGDGEAAAASPLTPAASAGSGAEAGKTKRGKKKAGDAGGAEPPSGVPLVRVQALMAALQETRQRNPTLFMGAMLACCRMVLLPQKAGAKPLHLVELRGPRECPAGGGRRARLSTRRKAASAVAAEVAALVLASVSARAGEKPTPEGAQPPAAAYAFTKAMLVHFVGELVELYPSILQHVVGHTVDGAPLTHYLLHECLPYVEVPPKSSHVAATAASVVSSAASYALLSMSGVAAEQGQQGLIVPVVVAALSASTSNGRTEKGVGMATATADLLGRMLGHPRSGPNAAKGAAGKAAQRSVTAVAKEVLSGPVVSAVCDVLQRVDMNHPDASVAILALLRVLTQAAERRNQSTKKEKEKDGGAGARGTGAAAAAGGGGGDGRGGASMDDDDDEEDEDTAAAGDVLEAHLEEDDGEEGVDGPEVTVEIEANMHDDDDEDEDDDDDDEDEDAAEGEDVEGGDDGLVGGGVGGVGGGVPQEAEMQPWEAEMFSGGMEGAEYGAVEEAEELEEAMESESGEDEEEIMHSLGLGGDGDGDGGGGGDPNFYDAFAGEYRHLRQRWEVEEDMLFGNTLMQRIDNLMGGLGINIGLIDRSVSMGAAGRDGGRGRNRVEAYSGPVLAMPNLRAQASAWGPAPPAGVAPAAYEPLSLHTPGAGSQAQTPQQQQQSHTAYRYDPYSMFLQDGAAPPGPGGYSTERVMPTQVSYSAEAIENAVSAYLTANAPGDLVTLPEPEPEPASVAAATDGSVTAAELPPEPPATPPEPATPEAENPSATPEEAQPPVSDVPPEAPASPQVPQSPQSAGDGGSDTETDEDLEAQLAAALAMSAEESAPVVEEAAAAAAPSSPAATLAQELERALALSAQDAGGVAAAAPAAVAETPAEPAPPAAAAAEPALDPTFVAALPEEIRREVLRENVHLLMTNTVPAGGGSTVDATFLAALPEAIRQEVLVHEQNVLRQRQSASAGPTEMDAATFMATLQPELRQEILQTSDEDFIAALPQDLAGEARELADRRGAAGWFHRVVADTPDSHVDTVVVGGGGGGARGRRSARVTRARATKARIALEDGAQLVELPCVPHLLRCLYLDSYGGSRSHADLRNQCGMRPFIDTLNAVTAHSASCRAVFSTLLYVLEGGVGPPPADAPGAEHAIRSALYGAPAYLASAAGATASSRGVPPVVLLRAIGQLVRLTPIRSSFFNIPTEQDAAVLAANAADSDASVEVARRTVLFRLLRLHATPPFVSSPKLAEALMALVQAVCQELCAIVEAEAVQQAAAAAKKEARARVEALRAWSEPREQALMACFDGVAEDNEEAQTAALAARDAHAKSLAEEAAAQRFAALKRRRAAVAAAEPTATQRLAATLFAHHETLGAVVRVLEAADTTAASLGSCLATLNAMCSARLAGGVVVRRLLQELLGVAEKTGRRTAGFLEGRAAQVAEAVARHNAAPTDATTAALRAFVSDEPPSMEMQLQRLTLTLASVAHHDHDTTTASDDVTLTPVTLKQLQGKWRSQSEHVAHVRGSTVVFESADGTLSSGFELEEPADGGSVRLADCGVACSGRRWVEWADGDVWRRDEDTRLACHDQFKEALQPLWAAAGAYLTEVEAVHHILGDNFHPPPRVLPIVEAFLAFHEIDPHCAYQPLLPVSANTPLLPESTIVDKGNMPLHDGPAGTAMALPRASSAMSLDPEEPRDPVKAFAARHKRLLNALIKANPKLLETSLRSLLGYASCVDFHNKRAWFRARVQRNQEAHGRMQTSIKVSRSNIFHDSFLRLRRDPATLKGALRVTFKGEEGVDGGGLTREWFQVLATEMFNPNYALFIPSEEGNTFQPNPNSSVNQLEHLPYFNFVGTVIGLAVYHGVMLDAYFTRSLYKHMLGIPPDYRDIQSVMPEYYKSLLWILENDPAPLEHDFTMAIEKFGITETIELCDDGKNIILTDANKHEYVQRVAEYKMTTTIKQQINEFLKGLFDIIPRHLLRIFSPEELELLICGTPDIDIADWKVCACTVKLFCCCCVDCAQACAHLAAGGNHYRRPNSSHRQTATTLGTPTRRRKCSGSGSVSRT